jgi:hypothetical protein
VGDVSVNPGVTGTFPMAETRGSFGTIMTETTNQTPGSFYEIYPGYGGWKRGQVAFAKAYLGEKWTDFRRDFARFFTKIVRNANTRRFYKLIMMQRVGKYIPVRTGHLYDALFRSLYFTHKPFRNYGHVMMMWFRWPLDRPMPIKGQTGHLPPAKGHGDPWGVIAMPIKDQAPNIDFIGYGPRGGLLYRLNDPVAMSDPTPKIKEEGLKQMSDMMRDVFKGMLVKKVHRFTAGQVRVSGGGTQISIQPKP